MASTITDKCHKILRSHPVTWSTVGVIHTLLCAGIVFGWASLLPILRSEGRAMDGLTPTDFTRIFTYGAVGNYLSTLPFGILLDRGGPRACGMVASTLFAAGLVLCSRAVTNATALAAGFALLGFAGPAIQLPTLHLARLFQYKADGKGGGGGGGGAALMMSAQAAAFDGGTAVFALFSLAAHRLGLRSSTFFLLYMVVPGWTFLTAALVWPNTVLPDADAEAEAADVLRRSSSSYGGAGSPFLSPARVPSTKNQVKKNRRAAAGTASSFRDAPLSTILRHPPFYCLAFWVSLHILKLNFVVATINDQLAEVLSQDNASRLVNVFGTMLPFGFVALPIVASLLDKCPMGAFQLANVVGLLYGSVLAFMPWNAYLQCLIVFPAVATSRQMVYSTVFHQTGELFGFANYGVLLGLTNVCVSLMSMVQNPFVVWAEGSGTYFGPNLCLDVATLPLFCVVWWAVLSGDDGRRRKDYRRGTVDPLSEGSPLLDNDEEEGGWTNDEDF